MERMHDTQRLFIIARTGLKLKIFVILSDFFARSCQRCLYLEQRICRRKRGVFLKNVEPCLRRSADCYFKIVMCFLNQAVKLSVAEIILADAVFYFI